MNKIASLSIDAKTYRKDFPILGEEVRPGVPLVYLDNAASTQRPSAVMEAMTECYSRYYANVHRGIHTLSEESTERYENARQTVCKFVNAASEREILFTSGTTGAINLVARSWGDANVSAGDVILTTVMEHHANIVPWQQLAERTGCRVEFVPVNSSGEIETDVLAKLLQELSPKLFAFTAASNVLGTINPVEQFVQMAHDVDALVMVDAAQAAPHSELDVQKWDADFLSFSAHKVCGPTGIGILYGKEALLESMPPFLGGGAMIHSVTTEGFQAADLPEKFEAGTPPIAEAIGFARAIEYVTEVGLSSIAAYERELCQLAHDQLADVEGVRILGPSVDRKVGIVSLEVDGTHPHDISQWMDRKGIAIRAGHHCAMPLHAHEGISSSSRASFYFYNTPDEVSQFTQALAEAQAKFSRPARQ